uniref:Uncharacterized protein n=1 Tax=Oryza brachyantha TaxID=4533 RepID=J3N6S5_ORYBR
MAMLSSASMRNANASAPVLAAREREVAAKALDDEADGIPDVIDDQSETSDINDTISADLADMVMERDAGARTAWLAIETQFLGNRETRALIIDARFRSFTQGDLSIADYYHRFKKMANDLDDLGKHVSDRTLILNVIRGLSERFHDIGTHHRRGRPFPAFADVVSELTMEELTMVNRPSVPSTTLVATSQQAPNASRLPQQPQSASGSTFGAA